MTGLLIQAESVRHVSDGYMKRRRCLTYKVVDTWNDKDEVFLKWHV